MSARRGISLVVVLVAATVLPAAADDQQKEDRTITRDATLSAAGAADRAKAVTTDRVVAEAPTAQTRAKALVDSGLLIERKRTDTPPVAELDAAALRYSEAFELASGALKIQAANNLAANRLRAAQPREALEVMERVWAELSVEELDPAARSRCLFNYARAAEQTGDRDRAVRLYVQAVEADPGFEPAARSVARLASDPGSQGVGVPELLAITDRLLAAGDPDLAADLLRPAIETAARSGDRDLPLLLARLLEIFTAARVGPAEFAREWQTFLTRVGPRDRRIRFIVAAFQGRLSVELAPHGDRRRFGEWPSPTIEEAVSPFLKGIGDDAFRSGDTRRALALYSNAWSLDPTNMDAGLYLANLLVSGAEDDGLLADALDEFLTWAFNEKGAAYLGQDWESILKFHIILGTVFSRMERWGPERDPRSALFQWSHALDAHRRLAEETGDAGHAFAAGLPNIQANLGRAYLGAGRENEAWTHFVTAADGFLDLGQSAEALPAYRAAVEIGTPANAADVALFERVTERIIQ